MSVRIQNERFVFPDTQPGDLASPNNNMIWTDDNTALDIDTFTFTAENAGIEVVALRNDNAHTGNGYDLDNVVVKFVDNGVTAQIDSANQLAGTNSFRNCTFIRDANELTTSGRLVFGNFIVGDARGPATNSTEIIGCRFIATDSRNPIAILNIGFGEFTLQNTEFIGAVAGQFYQGFQSVGTTWAAIGANDGVGTGTGPYFARSIHQGIANSNNVTNNNRLPNNAAIYLVNDDMSSATNLGTSIQLNHSSAVMIVNGLTGGRDIDVTYHSGGGGVAVARPAGVYKFVGWKPEWINPITGATVPDVRIEFGHISYAVPEYTNDATFLSTLNTNSIAGGFVRTFDATDANYRGFWIETSRDVFTAAAAGDSTAAPANSTYMAKSFSHDVSITTETAIPLTPVTNANNEQEQRLGDLSTTVDNFIASPVNSLTDALVGDYTAGANVGDTTDGTAPRDGAPGVTTLDDAYAGLKRNWYWRADFMPFAFTGNGSAITLNRDIIVDASVFSHPTTGEVGIPTPGLEAGALINTIVATGRTFDLSSTRLPSNTTIVGGTWERVGVTAADNVTFVNNPNIEVQVNDITEWDTTSSVDTGGVTISSLTARTVDVTQDQVDAGYTEGTNVAFNVTVAPYRLTFTHEAAPNAGGGRLAVFSRTNSFTGPWAQEGTTQVVTGSNTGMVQVSSRSTTANSEYLVIWRPFDSTHYTTVRRYDYTGGIPIQEESTITVPNVVIPNVVLAIANNTASVTWRSADVVDTSTQPAHNECIGTIVGAHANRLTGGQTQALLLEAYSDPAYFETIMANVNMIFGTDQFDTTTDVWDLITPTSTASTSAQGRYVQLEAGAQQGTQVIEQQQITGVVNSDAVGEGQVQLTDFLTADISAEESPGVTVTFPAVQIFDNPAGISGDQVRTALVTDLQAINTNVIVASVKPPAVQSAQDGNVQI